MNSTPTTIQSLIMLAITLGIGILAVLALRTFAPDWSIHNRNLVSIIIGSIILTPWLVVVVRMRKPA